MGKPLGCFLLDAIHILHGIIPSLSKVLEEVIDVVIPPELQQSLLRVFLSYSNNPDKVILG